MAIGVDATAEVLTQLKKDDGLAFKSAFSNLHIENALQRFGCDFRDRALPPDVVLLAFCNQLISADSSCREAVARINRDRKSSGLSPISANTSAYCQARARLPLALLKALARETGNFLEQEVLSSWLWLGNRHAKLIDGSTLLMSDTPSNQVAWPQHGQQEEGSGFPIMRIVGMMSLATGACLDLSFGPYQGKETGEHALARQILSGINIGDIIFADRYYCSYMFIAQLLKQGADIVTRIHGARNQDIETLEDIEQGDSIIELVKPPRPKWMEQEEYDSIPSTLELRQIKSGIEDADGEELVVITTLVDPIKYPRSEVLGAFHLRWNVELDLRSLKTVMGMEFLQCKSPEMVKKEIWTYILAYNLIRLLICRAAEKHNIEPRSISFKGAIQIFNTYSPIFKWVDKDRAQDLYCSMIDMIAQLKIPHRPGRKEPKAVKRRPKPYPRLVGPRHQT